MTDNVIELVVNNKRPVDKDDPANWPKWKKEIAMSLGHPERIFEEYPNG
jgi:hypothetical protein